MKSRPFGTIIAGVASVIGILVLVFHPSFAVEVVYPVENAWRAVSTSVGARLAGVFRGSAAVAENVRLRREVAALVLQKRDVERLEAENARLRRALGYRDRDRGSWIAAGVLSSGGGAAGVHDTVRVDCGAAAGVTEGAVVVVPDGLVGRVTAVSPHTAEITLITDSSVKVACEIESGSVRMQGILCGGGDVLVLRHLSGRSTVSPSARVLTSGRGGVFPRGLAVGTLLEVQKDSRGIVCEGEVRPAVDFSALEDVFIRREN